MKLCLSWNSDPTFCLPTKDVCYHCLANYLLINFKICFNFFFENFINICNVSWSYSISLQCCSFPGDFPPINLPLHHIGVLLLLLLSILNLVSSQLMVFICPFVAVSWEWTTYHWPHHQRKVLPPKHSSAVSCKFIYRSLWKGYPALPIGKGFSLGPIFSIEFLASFS